MFFSFYSPLCCTKTVKILNVCGPGLFLHVAFQESGFFIFSGLKSKAATKDKHMANTEIVKKLPRKHTFFMAKH